MKVSDHRQNCARTEVLLGHNLLEDLSETILPYHILLSKSLESYIAYIPYFHFALPNDLKFIKFVLEEFLSPDVPSKEVAKMILDSENSTLKEILVDGTVLRLTEHPYDLWSDKNKTPRRQRFRLSFEAAEPCNRRRFATTDRAPVSAFLEVLKKRLGRQRLKGRQECFPAGGISLLMLLRLEMYFGFRGLSPNSQLQLESSYDAYNADQKSYFTSRPELDFRNYAEASLWIFTTIKHLETFFPDMEDMAIIDYRCKFIEKNFPSLHALKLLKITLAIKRQQFDNILDFAYDFVTARTIFAPSHAASRFTRRWVSIIINSECSSVFFLSRMARICGNFNVAADMLQQGIAAAYKDINVKILDAIVCEAKVFMLDAALNGHDISPYETFFSTLFAAEKTEQIEALLKVQAEVFEPSVFEFQDLRAAVVQLSGHLQAANMTENVTLPGVIPTAPGLPNPQGPAAPKTGRESRREFFKFALMDEANAVQRSILNSEFIDNLVSSINNFLSCDPRGRRNVEYKLSSGGSWESDVSCSMRCRQEAAKLFDCSYLLGQGAIAASKAFAENFTLYRPFRAEIMVQSGVNIAFGFALEGEWLSAYAKLRELLTQLEPYSVCALKSIHLVTNSLLLILTDGAIAAGNFQSAERIIGLVKNYTFEVTMRKAVIEFHKGKTSKASTMVYCACQELKMPIRALERVRALGFLSALLLAEKNYEKASILLEEALKLAQRSRSRILVSYITRRKFYLYMHTEKYELARKMLYSLEATHPIGFDGLMNIGAWIYYRLFFPTSHSCRRMDDRIKLDQWLRLLASKCKTMRAEGVFKMALQLIIDHLGESRYRLEICKMFKILQRRQVSNVDFRIL